MARSIKKAKELKANLIEYCNEKWSLFSPEVKIVIHENDLAFEITFQKNTSSTWSSDYNGFPLIIKQPKL